MYLISNQWLIKNVNPNIEKLVTLPQNKTKGIPCGSFRNQPHQNKIVVNTPISYMKRYSTFVKMICVQKKLVKFADELVY